MAPMKKSIIDHTYRDYSQTELSDLIDDSDRKNKDDLFPAKLHRILATPEYANIIAWKPHGRAWAVINKPVFVNQILPRHFQHSNYEVERRVYNYRKNWQNDSLLRSVVNTAMDDIEDRNYVDQTTGELINERQIVEPFIEAVINRLLKCAAFRDWRVTALREYMPGVDPDNYCEVERSTKAVIRRMK